MGLVLEAATRARSMHATLAVSLFLVRWIYLKHLQLTLRMIDSLLLTLAANNSTTNCLLSLTHHVLLMLILLLDSVYHARIYIVLLGLRVHTRRRLTCESTLILLTNAINSFLTCYLLLVLHHLRLGSGESWFATSYSSDWSGWRNISNMHVAALQSHGTARALFQTYTVLLSTLHHSHGWARAIFYFVSLVRALGTTDTLMISLHAMGTSSTHLIVVIWCLMSESRLTLLLVRKVVVREVADHVLVVLLLATLPRILLRYMSVFVIF